MLKLIKSNEIFANENNRILIYNIFGSFLIKGTALIISFITIPAYIEYFDNQLVLGLWFTILSVLTWILTFDLGIGNGLRNNLVQAIVAKNNMLIKRYISSAYVIIGIVVIVVIIIFSVLFRFVNWNLVFNISNDIVSNRALSITVYIVFISIMLQLFFKLISSIMYALQKSSLNNIFILVTNLMILFFVSIDMNLDISSKLIVLAIVYCASVNLPLVIMTAIIFNTKLKNNKPSIKYFNKISAGEVLRLGSVFFWVQILYMLLSGTNELLITWLISPEKVVDYQLYNRVFTMVGIVFTLALTPIWSMVTKAISEKKYAWVKKLYNLLKWVTLLGIVCEFTIIIFLQLIMDLWLGVNSIEINYFFAITYALYGSMFIWIGVLSSITNGLGELKIQNLFYTIGLLIKFPAAYILVLIIDSWIAVVLSNLIALILFCIVQPIWLDKYLKKRIKEA